MMLFSHKVTVKLVVIVFACKYDVLQTYNVLIVALSVLYQPSEAISRILQNTDIYTTSLLWLQEVFLQDFISISTEEDWDQGLRRPSCKSIHGHDYSQVTQPTLDLQPPRTGI